MNDFSSALSVYISEFLMCRDAFGYKTDEHLRLLRSFDEFFLSNGYKTPVLPQEAVMGWVFKGTTGRPKDRAAIMCAFGKYLRDAGVPSFIPPIGLFGTSAHNRPYAFNGDELRRLFIEIDDASGKSKIHNAKIAFPVYYRLTYTCGLRPAESRNLWRSDIDLDSGSILIRRSKKNKSRIVVMSSDMLRLCRRYDEMRKLSSQSEFFFPNADGRPFSGQTLQAFFKKCWQNVNPSLPEDSLPKVCVYSLRHQFATQNIHLWIAQGKNVTAMIPRLSAYMGHDNFSETAYYVHLIPEDITNNSGIDWSSLGTVIPEVEDGEE